MEVKLRDGKIQNERSRRKKHSTSMKKNAIEMLVAWSSETKQRNSKEEIGAEQTNERRNEMNRIKVKRTPSIAESAFTAINVCGSTKQTDSVVLHDTAHV